MFAIIFKGEAIRRLKKMKRFHAVAVLDAIERHLREEPEKTSRTSIKRLRGHQETTFRLRAGDYRIFYDVIEDRVEIVQILHKLETPSFYRRKKE
ncbi:MAG: type II toxin-antitoxin system RelE/ParE family toxin [Candidatus Rokubacteria bacterium]|nr:type II toxin-antitoxin system RelE/ParE family toxin [Candidatus Rokubacteria bacterium]